MISRPLIILALALSLSGCEPKTIDHYITVLQGSDAPAEQTAFLAIAPSSSEEVAVAVEPSVPPCVPGTATYMNRFYLYDSCTNELIGPDPRYW